jgi:asparagine N-glycosylation enzyme membrane subunit Stt3
MTTPAPPDDPVISAIRTNIVFEKMVVSVLTVAGAAGAVHWAISFAAGGFGAGALGSSFISAATFTLLFFFTAFAAAVVVAVPLFLQLEKRRLRFAWPYAVAAALVGLLVLSAAGAAPSFEAPWRALHLVPGVAAAILFARKMRPFWEAARRAEETVAPTIFRLH